LKIGKRAERQMSARKLRQLEADLAHIDRVSTLGEKNGSITGTRDQAGPSLPPSPAPTAALNGWHTKPPNLDRGPCGSSQNR